jgi:hypothetical protein
VDEQVDDIDIGPEPERIPGPARRRPSQNCFPDTVRFRRGDQPVELDRTRPTGVLVRRLSLRVV